MKIFKYLAGVIFLMTSCRGGTIDSSNPLAFFDEEVKLTAQVLHSGDEIRRAISLFFYKNFLIVSDHDDQYHFSAIDLKIDKLITRFGKIGDGPCEIRFPTSLQPLVGDQIHLGLYNRSKFEYLEIDMEAVLSGYPDDCTFQSQTAFDPNYQNLIKLDKNRIVGVGLFPNRYALSHMNESAPYEEYFGYYYKDQMKGYDYQTLAMAFQGDLLIKPGGGRFLATTRSSANFDIVGYDDNGLTLIKRQEFRPPKFQEGSGNQVSAMMADDNLYGFIDAKVTDSFLYLLFSGKTRLEDPSSSQVILVYNWDGEPIRKLLLDRNVNKISVAQDDSTLIGYADDGKANLYSFNLK